MDHAHDIKKEVRKYLIVFAALLILTIVTVAISYLHVSLPVAITLALVVASIKVTLVGCFFMHLISEKQIIYVLLGFVAFFFMAMMWLFIGGYFNLPQGGAYVP